MENNKELVTANIQGIKCDNGDCDYNDPTVSFDDYQDYINKPCPKCGENLLTESDYKHTVNILEFAKHFNQMVNMIAKPEESDTISDEDYAKVVMSLNIKDDKIHIKDVNVTPSDKK